MLYVKKKIEPKLPAGARAGAVKVYVILAKDGRLAKAEVIEGDEALEEVTLAALRQWQFKPFLYDRKPTDVRSEISIQVR